MQRVVDILQQPLPWRLCGCRCARCCLRPGTRPQSASQPAEHASCAASSLPRGYSWCGGSDRPAIVGVTMTTHYHDNTSPWQHVTTTTRHHDNTLLWQHVTMTTHYYDNTSPWQHVTMTTRHHDNTLLWQHVTMTTRHHDNTTHVTMTTQHHMTTRLHDNTSPWQHVTMTTRHHDNTSPWQHCRLTVLLNFHLQVGQVWFFILKCTARMCSIRWLREVLVKRKEIFLILQLGIKFVGKFWTADLHLYYVMLVAVMVTPSVPIVLPWWCEVSWTAIVATACWVLIKWKQVLKSINESVKTPKINFTTQCSDWLVSVTWLESCALIGSPLQHEGFAAESAEVVADVLVHTFYVALKGVRYCRAAAVTSRVVWLAHWRH